MRRLQLLEIKADALQFMKVQTSLVAVMNYNELSDSSVPDVALMPQKLRNYRCLLKKLENF